MYRKINSRGTAAYLFCSKTNFGWKATVKDQTFSITKGHNHLGDNSLVPDLMLRRSCMIRATGETTKLRQIFDEERAR